MILKMQNLMQNDQQEKSTSTESLNVQTNVYPDFNQEPIHLNLGSNVGPSCWLNTCTH